MLSTLLSSLKTPALSESVTHMALRCAVPAIWRLSGLGLCSRANAAASESSTPDQAQVTEAAHKAAIAAGQAAAYADHFSRDFSYNGSAFNLGSMAQQAAAAAAKSSDAAVAAGEAAAQWDAVQSALTHGKHVAGASEHGPAKHYQPSVGPAMEGRHFMEMKNPVAPANVTDSSECAAQEKPSRAEDAGSGYLASS